MERRKTSELLLLWSLSIFAIFVSVTCIENKCAACNTVAEELELGLLNEKPRNHLDMRHRLDSKGQRRGKVIDYRVSELRVVELLDGLCEKMQDYTLEKLDSTRQEWIKVSNWDNLTTGPVGFIIDIQNYDDQTVFLAHLEQLRAVSENFVYYKQEAKAYSKDISSYCGRLLEETEDELAELIKKGSVRIGDVSKILCQDLSGHCSKTSASALAKDYDVDGSDGEL